ncbi:MAG: hypothetical protein IPK04_18885 [Bdellovibrionales bacterium]|jgi:CRP-like cAMP-binding protein|nr:hypothetical protein [Bdellovibrionales bacterium]
MEKMPVRAENLFASFPQLRAELEQMKVAHHFRTGGIIFRAGEIPLGLYIVQEGLCKLEAISECGAARIESRLHPARGPPDCEQSDLFSQDFRDY